MFNRKGEETEWSRFSRALANKEGDREEQPTNTAAEPAASARERLEEVSDRELEQIRVVDGPAGERKADLEAQRAEG